MAGCDDRPESARAFDRPRAAGFPHACEAEDLLQLVVLRDDLGERGHFARA